LAAQFSLAEANLLRSLLKYFDGPKVFANSIDTIEELARDYNSREKQVFFFNKSLVTNPFIKGYCCSLFLCSYENLQILG